MTAAAADTFKGNGKSNNVWTCGRIGGGIDAEGRMPAVWNEQAQRHKGTKAEDREQTTENRQKDWVVVPELEAPLITEDSWEKAAATLAGKSPAIIPALVQYLDIKDVRGFADVWKRRLRGSGKGM